VPTTTSVVSSNPTLEYRTLFLKSTKEVFNVQRAWHSKHVTHYGPLSNTVNKILSVSLLHVVSLEFLYISDLNKNNKKPNHNSFTAI
jgi:hypothetical protein